MGGSAAYLHSFLTSALDGDEWPTSRRGRFIPGKTALLPTELKAVWAIGAVWTFGRTEISLFRDSFIFVVQPIA
jgi:hypothetical protein